MDLVAAERCVMLDGAIGTELIDVSGARPEADGDLWGVTAVADRPERVGEVHRRYADAGCDVLTTNTWGLPTALRQQRTELLDHRGRPVHWMDVARRGVALARGAAEAAGRRDECAIAFSLNGDIEAADGHETIRLLARALDEDPPDLILLETLSLVRDSTYATVERLVDTGLPLWLSFRRCRHGLCGVYGEHWGGPEGDAFGRAARRFEELGVGALLINCIPPDHVPGMVSWLRDFTDLPLGVAPNLGYLSANGWRSEPSIGEAQYAELARGWRAEGAQIIGGCCGVGPAHIRAARNAIVDQARGTSALAPPARDGPHDPRPADRPWIDERGRSLFPVPLPRLEPAHGSPPLSPGTLLLWKHLLGEAVGAHARCLDVGCGPGLLSVQLALNGAVHVHALDAEPANAAATLSNAFLNDVSHRVTAQAIDLFPWVPEERYDVIVAGGHQIPMDPFAEPPTHRSHDYWGRSELDHLIGLLPAALAEDGAAYVVQLSIAGRRRTAERLAAIGYASRVVDFAFADLHELVGERLAQVERVEGLSDAYHVRLGARELAVAYLLKIWRQP